MRLRSETKPAGIGLPSHPVRKVLETHTFALKSTVGIRYRPDNGASVPGTGALTSISRLIERMYLE